MVNNDKEVLEQPRKQQMSEMHRQEDIEQQRLEFKNVLDQLVQERIENQRLREGLAPTEAQQQRAEFKNVLDQLVQEREVNKRLRVEDSVSRADFNKVLEELTRDREEARKDAREQLAHAHQRELGFNERENAIREEARQRELKNTERENANREEARETRQEMANLYQLMLTHQQAQQNPSPDQNPSSVQSDQGIMMTELRMEHKNEINSLHQLLKNLQQTAHIFPTTLTSSVIHPEPSPSPLPTTTTKTKTTTTAINSPTTPIPTKNSSSVVHPEPSSPAPSPLPEITVHPPNTNSQTDQIQQTKDEWQTVAELLYSKRSNNHLKNYEQVTEILAANPSLFAPLLERCPNVGLIIAHLLKLRFGLTVQKVSWTSSISDWNGEDCRR